MPLRVPPSPRKCLAVARTWLLSKKLDPSPCKPRIKFLPSFETNSGSSAKPS